ncbi:hypothetical protein BC938DRAFT_477784 [Jimgerdemannia flammicorona]|uniref:Uncharacterized protein n=1 Tax=Jimgerdemannia flammicorona TaxID=994334 RepID=A0A433QNV7_9FUNG|nr:hypothetical protein BC938DRAFT_477784 [Jimgerdemannia flammicorona]
MSEFARVGVPEYLRENASLHEALTWNGFVFELRCNWLSEGTVNRVRAWMNNGEDSNISLLYGLVRTTDGWKGRCGEKGEERGVSTGEVGRAYDY